MGKLKEVYQQPAPRSYITPLFWQHGEDAAILREEIAQMDAKGIGGFILESRPHPDFLGDMWWRDLDLIMSEAEKRGMKVWVFDDQTYPSGFCAGKIRDHHPEYLKVYLAERHIDAKGPLVGSSFRIQAWLEAEEQLVRVVAARRVDGCNRIDAQTLLDLTGRIDEGILYWDVPEGDWRVFVLVQTRHGGEEWTKDWLNPLQPEAVALYIQYVYEEHWNHYGDKFGATFAGFFSDESRFGNASSCEASIGRFPMVLPYCPNLLDRLNEAWGGDFGIALPCLWYEAGDLAHEVRFTYMDVVSNLYSEAFCRQIGDWCRQHQVKLIGHVVEDNGAHTRLGYGNGHFFRSIAGQDYSGLDLVCQLWPEQSSGWLTTPHRYQDNEFFYWGIAKMASSAGHIDPKKHGTTVCEIFGTYGWQAGLKLMKWLTDHICVRGVNFIIPHAFSPIYPDPDCPPHFYARGQNPQWRYFQMWSAYANRVCHLLSGGQHIAPVAVVYHAEAEWSGEYMPFEQVVKSLMSKQIDCDVLPIDTLLDAQAVEIGTGQFRINGEAYRALVVPFAERLPEALLARLLELATHETQVLFIDAYPTGSSRRPAHFDQLMAKLVASPWVPVSSLAALPDTLRQAGVSDIEVSSPKEYLQYYHYTNGDEHRYFFTNESTTQEILTRISFGSDGVPVAYDAMEDRLYTLDYSRVNDRTSIELKLGPYESTFVIFSNDGSFAVDGADGKSDWREPHRVRELTGNWGISTAEAGDYPKFRPASHTTGLGNVAVPGVLPTFSGTIRYQMEFELSPDEQIGKIALDLGGVYETAEVWLNEKSIGTRICPPYRFELQAALLKGRNQLRIEVTNTLAKKLGDNYFDRTIPQEPSGLLGPVRLLWL